MTTFLGRARPPLVLELARQRNLGPARIAGLYALAALIWIALSDLALGVVLTDAEVLSRIQTAKGILFVALTTGLLFALIRRDAGILAGAEQEIREADREVERLVQFPRLSPSPVIVLNERGEILYRNDSALQAAAGAQVDDHDLLPDDIEEITRSCLASGEPMRPGVVDVGDRHYDWTYFPHPETGVVYAFANDRTDELQLAVRAIQGYRFEALRRLAAGVAHDFNNILVAISRVASLLDDRVRGNEEADRLIGQLHLAAGHGTEMVEQLRDFARPSSGTRDLIEINHEIRRVERLLQQATGLSVRVELQLAEQDLLVRMRPGMLMQVLMNLVQNAADASRPASTVVIATRRAAEPGGEHAILIVSDTGSGMSDEVRQQVFRPFFTTKQQEGGSGLGLMSVNTVVRDAGGTVDIDTAPGRGTTMIVSLPLASEARELAPS